MLRDSPHVYSSALKQLICPSSGKLEELAIGDDKQFSSYKDDDGGDVLASLLSAPSTLVS